MLASSLSIVNFLSVSNEVRNALHLIHCVSGIALSPNAL